MIKSSESIVYVATGKRHLREVINNATASRGFISSYRVVLYTDSRDDIPDGLFSDVILLPSPSFSYRDKIYPLINLPSEICLFLDSDTRVIHDLAPIFSALGNNHIAAAFAPVRKPPGWCDSSVPSFFPELNSGVLLLRRCRKQKALIKSWLHLYDILLKQYNQNWDQASLRSVIWKFHKTRNLKYTLLPQEANLRLTKPWVAGRGLPVAILHGRASESEFATLIRYLNQDIDRFRTWSEWVSLYPDTEVRPRHDRTFT